MNRVLELAEDVERKFGSDVKFADLCRTRRWIMPRPFLADEFFHAGLFIAYARFSGYLDERECRTLEEWLGDSVGHLYCLSEVQQVTFFQTCTNISDWCEQESLQRHRAGITYALLANAACGGRRPAKCVY